MTIGNQRRTKNLSLGDSMTICSFCKKNESQLKKIIAIREDMSICNECVCAAITSIIDRVAEPSVESSEEPSDVSCDFCGKSSSLVTKMATRSESYICNQCLVNSIEILIEEARHQEKVVEF